MTTPVYTTAANIKALMPDTTWGTKYDALFTTLITRASRLVDGLLRRQPGAFSVTDLSIRYFTGSGTGKQYIGELAAAPSAVRVAETGVIDTDGGSGGTYTLWAAADYYCWPPNRLADGKPYLRLDVDVLNGSKTVWYKYPKAVKVTGYFGFATSSNQPEEIKGAVEIQTVRWFKRGQQAFQDAGAITDLNQLRYVKDLDPDIKQVLLLEKFAHP
ncbi:MAG TPA: hypothetical protein PKC99_06150 [Anaerolineales bacterium]|nr:hypothetical protein [Anaerolineales bacterium]